MVGVHVDCRHLTGGHPVLCSAKRCPLLLILLALLFITYRLMYTVQAFVARDPRFDDLSGEFSESYFKQSYDFLSDVKLREKQVF